MKHQISELSSAAEAEDAAVDGAVTTKEITELKHSLRQKTLEMEKLQQIVKDYYLENTVSVPHIWWAASYQSHYVVPCMHLKPVLIIWCDA